MPYKRHHEVKIYTSPESKMCDLAKTYFLQAGIDFDEVSVTPGTDNEKLLLEASGDNKTPTVDFDGRMIVGYQPEVYDILTREDEKKSSARSDAGQL